MRYVAEVDDNASTDRDERVHHALYLPGALAHQPAATLNCCHSVPELIPIFRLLDFAVEGTDRFEGHLSLALRNYHDFSFPFVANLQRRERYSVTQLQCLGVFKCRSHRRVPLATGRSSNHGYR